MRAFAVMALATALVVGALRLIWSIRLRITGESPTTPLNPSAAGTVWPASFLAVESISRPFW